MPRATVDDLRGARRVLLHGVTGSGKSTAAVRLAEVLDLPAHLVDDEIGWLPGWQLRDEAEQRALAARITEGDRWVLDSTYGSFREVVLPHVQVIVALDYPRWLSQQRLVRRTLHRWATRRTVCNGNVERLHQLVSRDSIIVWHFRSYGRKAAQVEAWVEAADGIPPVLRLRHPRELEQVLDQLAAG